MILTYAAIGIGCASLIVNVTAFHRKSRRRWLYLFGIVASVWFMGSYLLPVLGLVPLDILINSGVLRWGALMGMSLVALHAIVDT